MLRVLAAVTQKIPVAEDLLRIRKSDSAFMVFTKFTVFASIKVESQAGITLIPRSMPPADIPGADSLNNVTEYIYYLNMNITILE